MSDSDDSDIGFCDCRTKALKWQRKYNDLRKRYKELKDEKKRIQENQLKEVLSFISGVHQRTKIILNENSALNTNINIKQDNAITRPSSPGLAKTNTNIKNGNYYAHDSSSQPTYTNSTLCGGCLLRYISPSFLLCGACCIFRKTYLTKPIPKCEAEGNCNPATKCRDCRWNRMAGILANYQYQLPID